MNKPQVCMFCRYRKSRALDAEACCAAAELARHGVLDILSSDYYPASLLHAAWLLAGQDNDYDLPAAIATVSRAPARAAGMDDRGEIRVGLRADLVQAKAHGEQPVIQQVWRQARRVF